jgi:hypothetical protein
VRTQEDWARVRERKLLYWADQYRRFGPRATLEAAEELRMYVQSLRPTWPDATVRQKDLAQHMKMRSIFDRAAHALVFHTHRRAAR